MTVKEYLTWLKNTFFGGENIEEVISMNDDVQREHMLAHIDALLGDTDGKAKKFVDEFWANGDMQTVNPLLNVAERANMTDDEQIVCAYYVSTASLCRALYANEQFDPIELGVNAPDEFFVDNEPLTRFVLTTKHTNIALHIAHTMRLQAVSLMEEVDYQPAQDMLARMESASAKDIVKALTSIDKHLLDGRAKGMDDEDIILHDEICGEFMTTFRPKVVKAAHQIAMFMSKKMPYMQSQKALDEFEGVLDIVRENILGDDYLEEDSLAMDYLLAHAERKIFNS